jgi:hypothetical protein
MAGDLIFVPFLTQGAIMLDESAELIDNRAVAFALQSIALRRQGSPGVTVDNNEPGK